MSFFSINRKNLGRQILAGRAIVKLTRVDLAKKAGLAHPTLKLAEEGDSSVSEDALGKICHALEALGFEFMDGTLSTSLSFHEEAERSNRGFAADMSMPGGIRAIYPRRLDVHDLIRDLGACGVQIVDQQGLLLSLCISSGEHWAEMLVKQAIEGRKVGIFFRWLDVHENLEGVRRIGRLYGIPEASVNLLLQNVMLTQH